MANERDGGHRGRQESLGLCLSGAAFRAAFYSLGALRYLAEAGHIGRVDVISSVSGGSITAAAVADRWTAFEAAGGTLDAFLSEIDQPFRSRVTTENLRNAWARRVFLAFFRPRSGGRGVALGRTLARHLYEHKRVAELPPRPQVILTSTDLTVGRAFRIHATSSAASTTATRSRHPTRSSWAWPSLPRRRSQ